MAGSGYAGNLYLSIEDIAARSGITDLNENVMASYQEFIKMANRQVDAVVKRTAAKVPLDEDSLEGILAKDLAYQHFLIYKAQADDREPPYIQHVRESADKMAARLIEVLQSDPTRNPRSVAQAHSGTLSSGDLWPPALDAGREPRDYSPRGTA